MTDLDTLARSATRELLDRSSPDVAARYAELRRVRSRRAAAKLVAVAAAVALAAGGWQLAGRTEDRAPEPAPEPGRVVNGSLVAPRESAPLSLVTLIGEPIEHLDGDDGDYSHVGFTADGGRATYSVGRTLMAVDLASGARRALVTCMDEQCAGALSPDGTTVAYGGIRSLRLQSVASGKPTIVDLDVATVGNPAWSPDGATLAFVGTDGLYTVRPDGSELRLIHRATDPTTMFLDVAWSPDASSIAFFDTELISRRNYNDTRFTAMTVSADGTDRVPLHDAGHCFCAGLSAPSLTWSPDGELIAVATTKLAGGTGVYTVRPDGSDWRIVAGGYFGNPAWQPVIE